MVQELLVHMIDIVEERLHNPELNIVVEKRMHRNLT